MNRVLLPTVVMAALVASGCAAPPVRAARSDVLPLGNHYESHLGSLFIIKVQDEYRLIRCITSGPIAGCYDQLFSVPLGEVKFNRWMTVDKVPGLDVSIVSPEEVAFRVNKEPETPQK